jgi:hypothetical protein
MALGLALGLHQVCNWLRVFSPLEFDYELQQ